MRLKTIPVIDAAGDVAKTLATGAQDELRSVLGAAERQLSRPLIAVGDRISKRWLARSATPYADEISDVARDLGRSGAYFLNLSYEWACTTGAVDDPDLGGPTMLRVLDWRLHGLGQSLVAARVAGQAGDYLSLTWPGFAGVLTGMAPGRFSSAINQTPMPYSGFGKLGDWVISRRTVWRSTALPPTHLLRLAFDTCDSYDEAQRLLAEREIASPAFFVLSGIEPGQTCLIERTQTEARISASASVANHWRSFDRRGTPRGHDSLGRLRLLDETLQGGPDRKLDWKLDWLRPPILNPDTCLVAVMNARAGHVLAQGWEKNSPATEILDYRG